MKIGSKAEHIFTKDWMLVLQVATNGDGTEKILCRTKDLREIWFYDFELKTIK